MNLSSLLAIVAFLGGAIVVAGTVLSAVRTVVMPHGRPSRLSWLLFGSLRRLVAMSARTPLLSRRHHEVRSLYAPIALVCLPLVWLTTAMAGFTAMFWALGTHPLREAFRMAGSAMLTLGSSSPSDMPRTVLGFFAAALAISVLALLLVTYLPTMYQAYSSREQAVAALETFAGDPPDPVTLLVRHHRIGAEDRLDEIWISWRAWFFEARDTHTALPAVVLFRSSSADREWVLAVGALLDSAALWNSVCRSEQDPDASLCLRAGALALNDIAALFRLPSVIDPQPGGEISVARDHFDEMYELLAAEGIAVVADRDQAWRDWSGWRVNYDLALNGLARLTGASMSPR